MDIPNIDQDKVLIDLIDEIKFKLKCGQPYSPMRAEFNAVLNAFISKWRLDTDPHAFATEPNQNGDVFPRYFEPSFVTNPLHADKLHKIIDIDPTGKPMTITARSNNHGSMERLERLWRGEREPELKRVGFWKSERAAQRMQTMMDSFARNYFGKSIRDPNEAYPDVHDFIDPSWKTDHPDEYKAVIDHLHRGKTKDAYKGSSSCRICGRTNGSCDMTDGVWVWPEGFVHYLVAHDVKPPQEFIAHVLRKP